MNFLKNIFNKKQKSAVEYALDCEVERRKGNLKTALESINKAIELEKNNDMFYASRSNVKKSLNDKQGALEDINKAIELQDSVNAYKKMKEALSY